jgi:hypothetical protein
MATKRDTSASKTKQSDTETGKVFYDKLTYVYLELPKFSKTEDELETLLDKWMFVFKHLASLDERPKALQERVFKRLFRIAEIEQLHQSGTGSLPRIAKALLGLHEYGPFGRKESRTRKGRHYQENINRKGNGDSGKRKVYQNYNRKIIHERHFSRRDCRNHRNSNRGSLQHYQIAETGTTENMFLRVILKKPVHRLAPVDRILDYPFTKNKTSTINTRESPPFTLFKILYS